MDKYISLLELVKYYYQTNCAGGNLHVLLDDGNTEYSTLQFCLDTCEDQGDLLGALICEMLYSLPEKAIQEFYQRGEYRNG